MALAKPDTSAPTSKPEVGAGAVQPVLSAKPPLVLSDLSDDDKAALFAEFKAATTAEPRIQGPSASDLHAKIHAATTMAHDETQSARLAALAGLQAPTSVRQEPKTSPSTFEHPALPGQDIHYSVPVIPLNEGISGTRHDWFKGDDAKAYLVLQLSFPCLVPDGKNREGDPKFLYKVGNWGDVVMLDDTHAEHGLKYRALRAFNS